MPRSLEIASARLAASLRRSCSHLGEDNVEDTKRPRSWSFLKSGHKVLQLGQDTAKGILAQGCVGEVTRQQFLIHCVKVLHEADGGRNRSLSPGQQAARSP